MMYVGSFRPYQLNLQNVVELVNEIVTTLCAYNLVLFSDYVPDPKTKYTFGWPIIVATTFLILFNLVIMCYDFIANIIHQCKLRCKRRNAIKAMQQKQQERSSVYAATK